MPRLRVDRVEGLHGWFIVPNDPPIGPYDTRKEAVAAKPGIVAFYKNCDRPGFVTSEEKDLRRKVRREMIETAE